MLNRVWTGLDALVLVYHRNAAGQRVKLNGTLWQPGDPPLVNYCYFQNTSLSADVPFTRRPVTGRPKRRILTQTEEWELNVETFYLGVDRELALEIFDREKILELVLHLQAPENLTEEEPHMLTPAKRVSFQISGRENDVLTGNAKFAAEDLLTEL